MEESNVFFLLFFFFFKSLEEKNKVINHTIQYRNLKKNLHWLELASFFHGWVWDEHWSSTEWLRILGKHSGKYILSFRDVKLVKFTLRCKLGLLQITWEFDTDLMGADCLRHDGEVYDERNKQVFWWWSLMGVDGKLCWKDSWQLWERTYWWQYDDDDCVESVKLTLSNEHLLLKKKKEKHEISFIIWIC